MTRSQRIPMGSLTALTLHSDRATTSRRTSPFPQLSCVGKACRYFQPEVVQCVPVGSDGANGLEWKCEADLPSQFRFGNVEVSCEGWDSSDDPYILKGSCGLTYHLVRSSSSLESSPYLSVSSFSPFNLSNLIPLAMLLFILYRLLTIPLATYRGLPRTFRNLFRGWGGGGGGGGGPGFGGGPPPPYSKTPGETWTPGFWTGMAAGAAALQGASMLRGNQQGAQRRNAGWGVGDDEDRGVGGSGSWGRGGGGGGGGAMRPSTGFGGTRNR